MKKGTLILITLLLMVIGYSAYNATINIYGRGSIAESISEFKVYFYSTKINDKEVSGIKKTKDEFTVDNIDGNFEYEIINDSTDYDADAIVECSSDTNTNKIVANFDYTGSEQIFTAPEDAVYKLELWGAQGATDSTSYHGGYGGYSTGKIRLTKNDKLYIYVGEKGKNINTGTAVGEVSSYPNGGAVKVAAIDTNKITYSTGGGSTHISTKSGQITNFYNSKSNLVAVAGGGGGACTWWGYKDNGGSGGGYAGGTTTINYSNGTTENNNPTAGTQRAGGGGGGNLYAHSATTWLNGTFGNGGGSKITNTYNISGSGGGGFFGGGASWGGSGAGGSGYIGNTLLKEKSMYCYNCDESSEIQTKTISTTCTSLTPTENCSKQGNGYVRITKISTNEKLANVNFNVEAQNIKKYRISNIKSESITCKLKVNKIERTSKNNYNVGHIWKYDYSGDEQVFIAPVSGVYKLETWGAQGATDSIKYHGGYGGYSTGEMRLTKDDKLYIYIGEKGKNINTSTTIGEVSAYPNGGTVGVDILNDHSMYYSTGGGSTHISTQSGLISDLSNNKNSIIIVSGGGGGTCTWWDIAQDSGGSGGGFKGTTTTSNYLNYENGTSIINNPTAGTQTTGGTGGGNLLNNSASYWLNGIFGIGGGSKVTNTYNVSAGGGGGYFGGGASWGGSGAGGSGYIGNSLLTNKSMYCYNCSESNEVSTKTISTTCTSSTPTEKCSKQGNGYARITLISID